MHLPFHPMVEGILPSFEATSFRRSFLPHDKRWLGENCRIRLEKYYCPDVKASECGVNCTPRHGTSLRAVFA
jgi:hypothetical protein